MLAGTAEARTEKWVYDGPHAGLTRYTDSYDKATVYDLDDRGAVESVTDPANRTTIYETNEKGLVTQVTDPAGKSSTMDYAGADPVRTTDQLGRVSATAFDSIGRPVLETDPRRATTETSYTAASEPATVTDPLGRTMSYEYDGNGNRTKIADPRGGATIFGHNRMEQVERITDPLGASELLEYDQNGNPTKHTSRRGICWRCGQQSNNPANMHLGHKNVPTSKGGNLNPNNVCLEGAACNLSAGNRGGPKPGRSCKERGGCGAPYGRYD